MMRVTVRSCLLAALAAAVLAAVWPGALAAQVSADLADALVRETYEAIREDALRPPDVLTLLHETGLTAHTGVGPQHGWELVPVTCCWKPTAVRRSTAPRTRSWTACTVPQAPRSRWSCAAPPAGSSNCRLSASRCGRTRPAGRWWSHTLGTCA